MIIDSFSLGHWTILFYSDGSQVVVPSVDFKRFFHLILHLPKSDVIKLFSVRL